MAGAELRDGEVHRDANALPNKISPFEAEMRRRTWFYVEAFDVLFSFQLGMPAIVDDAQCDSLGPANLLDDDFDETTEHMPDPRPPTDPTPSLYCTTKSGLCRILRRVVRHAHATAQPPYEKTRALDAELRQWYASVPACMRIRPIRTTSFTDANHTIMHRLMVELMFRKSLCVLHRTYLSFDRDNIEYAPSREACRESALRVLDLHAEFDLETRPGGRMHEDRYMLSKLAVHDFLIAAMVICLDLSESTATR